MLLPIRMAIFPVPCVADLIVVAWAAVRLDVRVAAPALVVLIAGNVMSVDPTDAHVPVEIVTGREVAGVSPASGTIKILARRMSRIW